MLKDTDTLGENSSYRNKHRCVFCKRYAVVILVVTGLLFTVTAVVCAITGVFKDWVEREIRKGVVLKPGNEVYRKWLHSETPTYLAFYMFNVTNADEVNSNGIPNLQELGPFTYRVTREITVLNRNNYTSSSITYLSNNSYVFDKDMSCDTCDPMLDKITNINLPFLTTVEIIINIILEKSPDALPFALAAMDEVYNNVGLEAFQTLTVNELLWGHGDPALVEANRIFFALVKSLDPSINMTLPERFALHENNTVDLYTIDSGEDNVDRVGLYLLWNKRKNITCWNDKYAAMINGTDALRFQPFISENNVFYGLVTSIYRSVTFVYDSITHVRGIRLLGFTLDPKLFESGDINGNNKGFCVTGKEKKCLPTGLLDISNCHPLHAPVVSSLPHFYLGDPKLQQTVKGLNPQKRIHATSIDIEPNTGLTMRGHKRIQMNVALHKIDGISAFKNINRVYLPLMYVDKHGRITEDDADDFKHDVRLPLRLSEAAPFVIFGIGAIFFLVAGWISYRRYRRDKKKPPSSPEEIVPLFTESAKQNQKPYGANDT